MNIETWGYIRHLFFVEQYSKKAIAGKLNLDPKTIRRALKKETFQDERPGPRASKIEAFREKISDLLKAYPGMSAVRIHEEIRKTGYPGGISILRTYLRPLRREKKTFFHIQTFPAEEAQVDWAYAGRIGDRVSCCFLMVLSFSKMLYLEFFPDQKLESFLAGHIHAFHYFQAGYSGDTIPFFALLFAGLPCFPGLSVRPVKCSSDSTNNGPPAGRPVLAAKRSAVDMIGGARPGTVPGCPGIPPITPFLARAIRETTAGERLRHQSRAVRAIFFS